MVDRILARDAMDRAATLYPAEQLVTSHQQELLRTAYLLSGDQRHAAELAEAACLALLPGLARAHDAPDWRERLL